ncbi:DUF2252 family protein [Roseivivax sp. GX 12232]|uniref:DUF2252 family protein n=1 Tax=Roseivivax sp. GX 12232 TaxID=2900547 RepID=UPI001E4952BB|nr:DUF2252 family protein [Roseivivax sp. GX 12232]MCE0505982.1 DUF2252 family protein [Roseivivax sp. GX 12232]
MSKSPRSQSAAGRTPRRGGKATEGEGKAETPTRAAQAAESKGGAPAKRTTKSAASQSRKSAGTKAAPAKRGAAKTSSATAAPEKRSAAKSTGTKTASTKRGAAKSTATSAKPADAATTAPVPPAAETPDHKEKIGSQLEAYRALAARYVEAPFMFRPADLTGQARREHVRRTILEDHALRIDQRAHGTRDKFEKLAGSLFSFFRGTSLLFHRDMLGADARMPTVLALGDVHPSNFGVMPNADNVPIFGVNDFDDAIYAPFSWDLKRGATGFLIAAEEEGGHKRKRQKKIARKFLRGYLDGIRHFARHETEIHAQMREDNAPKVIRRLFEEARTKRADWLQKRYLDDSGRGFRANDELTPISSRRDEFQGLIDALAKANGIRPEGRAGTLRVKDVAMRHGQGTASLGLPRYYCLLEGPSRDASDDLIVEFKQARRSALEGLVPPHDFDAGTKAERIAHGQSVHLSDGDVFYGSAEIDGLSFMSRERAPFREDIDLDDLSKKTWKRYAHACGWALALAHARSDDAGLLDYDIEESILEAVAPERLFIEDTLRFAEEAVARMRQDQAYYRQDLKMGAFDATLHRYR